MEMTLTEKTLAESRDEPTLVTLAEKINQEHQACEKAMNAGLQYALECGRLLIEAKKQVKHGQWQKWVDDHCEFSDRTTRTYMQIVNRWPEIEAKRQHAAVLSYRDAVRLLAEPKASVQNEGSHVPTAGEIRGKQREWVRVRAAGQDEINAMMAKRLQVIACFGAVLTWGAERKVPRLERLQWLCPNTGWMNEKRALSLVTTLAVQNAALEEKSASDIVGEMCEHFNSITPESPFPVICMCDIATAMTKFARNRRPEEEPHRVAPCEHYGQACVFGACYRRDLEAEQRYLQELEAHFEHGGPRPSWLAELFGEESDGGLVTAGEEA